MSDGVIRYVLRYMNAGGKVCYDGHGDSEHLSHAEKYTIRELNARLHDLFEMQRVRSYPIREIVRVRRVIGEPTVRLATNEEAAESMYGYGETEQTAKFSFEQSNLDRSTRYACLFKRVPGEARWEVVDE